jgi:hypothetical protein
VHDARRAGLTDRQLADTAGLSAKEIRRFCDRVGRPDAADSSARAVGLSPPPDA